MKKSYLERLLEAYEKGEKEKVSEIAAEGMQDYSDRVSKGLGKIDGSDACFILAVLEEHKQVFERRYPEARGWLKP